MPEVILIRFLQGKKPTGARGLKSSGSHQEPKILVFSITLPPPGTKQTRFPNSGMTMVSGVRGIIGFNS